MNFNKLLSWAFFISCLYFSIIFAVQIVVLKNFDAADAYIGALIFASAFVGYRNLNSSSKSIQNIFRKNETYFFLFLFLFQLILRILEIKFANTGLWLDELMQAKHSRSGIFASAIDYQPPLGYMSTHLNTLLFGYNEMGIKITSAYFSSLSGTLAYILFFYITESFTLSLILFLLLVTHRIFYQYSLEARSILVGLYFSLILYGFIIEYFKKNKTRLLDSLVLVSAGVMFLLSLGFQPPIILLAIALTLIILFCFTFDKIKLNVIFAITIGVVLFLPLQYVIYLRSPNNIKISSTNFFDEFFRNFEFSGLWVGIHTYRYYYLISVILFVVALVMRRFNLIHKSEVGKTLFLLIATLFLTMGAYIFLVCVRWPLNDYYQFLGIGPILISSAYSLKDILSKHKMFFTLSGSCCQYR